MPCRPSDTTRSSASGAMSGDSITVIWLPSTLRVAPLDAWGAAAGIRTAAPGPASRGSVAAGRDRSPACTVWVIVGPERAQRDPLAPRCVVLGDRSGRPHGAVEARGAPVDSFADAEVVGGVDDERDVGVDVGPRRVDLQFGGTGRPRPVDPAQAVAGTERADRRRTRCPRPTSPIGAGRSARPPAVRWRRRRRSTGGAGWSTNGARDGRPSERGPRAWRPRHAPARPDGCPTASTARRCRGGRRRRRRSP